MFMWTVKKREKKSVSCFLRQSIYINDIFPASCSNYLLGEQHREPKSGSVSNYTARATVCRRVIWLHEEYIYFFAGLLFVHTNAPAAAQWLKPALEDKRDEPFILRSRRILQCVIDSCESTKKKAMTMLFCRHLAEAAYATGSPRCNSGNWMPAADAATRWMHTLKFSSWFFWETNFRLALTTRLPKNARYHKLLSIIAKERLIMSFSEIFSAAHRLVNNAFMHQYNKRLQVVRI